MLGLQDRLRRKDEEIVAKIMDGEAIIINLANGIYYSLDNAGGAIWEMIEDGRRLDEIAAAIATRYDVPAQRVQEDVLRLAAELLHEELVIVLDHDEAPRNLGESTVSTLSHTSPYESPRLNAYRDMEDLLALDPPTPSLADIPWKA
jgi:hypothetical protein